MNSAAGLLVRRLTSAVPQPGQRGAGGQWGWRRGSAQHQQRGAEGCSSSPLHLAHIHSRREVTWTRCQRAGSTSRREPEKPPPSSVHRGPLASHRWTWWLDSSVLTTVDWHHAEVQSLLSGLLAVPVSAASPQLLQEVRLHHSPVQDPLRSHFVHSLSRLKLAVTDSQRCCAGAPWSPTCLGGQLLSLRLYCCHKP